MSSARKLRGPRVLDTVMSGLALLGLLASDVSSSIAIHEKQFRKQLRKKIVLEARKHGTKSASENYVKRANA
jgi:hypothetical protein